MDITEYSKVIEFGNKGNARSEVTGQITEVRPVGSGDAIAVGRV
jgi:hypothetical protein